MGLQGECGKMRILFCDDNPSVLEQLMQYTREFFSQLGGTMPEFAAYSTGDALLETEAVADIAFLDVEMPGISGIHIGAKLKQHNPKIKLFIVTAYPDYLDEAMRFQVFRYLSKPIDKNRLFRNLKDAMYQYAMESKVFPVETPEGIAAKRAEEIVCVEADGGKVRIHTTDGVLSSLKGIQYWRQTLKLPCFYACHRSYIVNMRFVYRVFKDKITLKYGDTTMEAYLTKRKFTEFKDTYLQYLGCVQ